MSRARSSSKNNSSANIGFEAKLWLAADKLRSNMDAAEYKHTVLGLIFLKYISDSFEEHHAKLITGKGEYAGANAEDPDEYKAENVFWVPPAARWTYLQNNAKQPTIGKIVDDAMVAIERDNPRLKGILPKDYARPALDKNRLGELIDLIGTIPVMALDRDKRTRAIPLTADIGLPGTLFIGSQHRATPPWVGMLNPFLTQEIPVVYTASISAVLIVQYQDRFFALTFGYGRMLLAPQFWVRDFGLRVTLNKVDPTKLRSVDSKIYDEMVVLTRRQTSQKSKVEAFELDVGRALLRGVTGDAEEHDIFSRVTGSTSVQVTTELALGDLGEILSDLLDAYTDDAYRDHFPWVDNVREVDPALHAELDQLLIDAIHGGDLAGAYLSAPEIVDWESIHRFSYTHAGDILYLELSLTDYLHVLEEHDPDVDISALKRHRVRVQYTGDETIHEKWSIYECLVWETTLGNRRFVLLDGLWFQIAPQYAEAVADYVTSITSADIPFQDAPEGQNEGQYNEAIEVQDPDNFALLDREPFVPTGAASQIEFCDLFSTGGHLIHVKKRSSSGTLSHLFSQGSVSSDLFLQDKQLRNNVRQRLNELGKPALATLIPIDRPNSPDYEVVYAVIAPPVHGIWPPALPFFSSVNLMHHAKRVQNLGFKVSLQYIRQAN